MITRPNPDWPQAFGSKDIVYPKPTIFGISLTGRTPSLWWKYWFESNIKNDVNKISKLNNAVPGLGKVCVVAFESLHCTN